MTREDQPARCQAAVQKPPHVRRGGSWHQCVRWSQVNVIHPQDGQPISLCRQHARIYESVLTPITRWQPKDEAHPDCGPATG